MALNSPPSDNKNQCPRVSRSSQYDSTFHVSELDQLDLAKKVVSIIDFASSQTVRGSFHLLCVLVDFCGALAAEFSHVENFTKMNIWYLKVEVATRSLRNL